MDREVMVVPGNVPAFLLKLWKIVEDKESNDLISWSQNGNAFRVHDQVEFSKQILPKFYKHNNFSSFVRQVNMYGFRKIIESGAMKHEKDEWEFYHQYFQQGNLHQLHMIKRKVHVKEEPQLSNPQIACLLEDVEKLKGVHEIVQQKMNLMKIENQMLWSEVSDLRDHHKNQQTVINKLIQFFVQLVMGKGKDITRKRHSQYPALGGKIQKTQDLQIQELPLQPYNPSSNSAISQLLQDTSYTVQSPTLMFDDRLTELSPDPVVVVDEGNFSIQPTDIMVNASNIQPDNLLTDVTNSEESPYPLQSTFKKESSPINMKDAVIKVIPSCPDQCDNDFSILTCCPDEVMLPVNNVKNLNPDPQTLLTPVVNMLDAPFSKPRKIDSKNQLNQVVHPPITRQSSFKDRNEIIQDVNTIENSIGELQDMLEKNQINLDLKSLSSLYSELPTQVSVQDLLRMMQQNEENVSDETLPKQDVVSESQLIPYTASFSPSQLINSLYPEVAENDQFFDMVDTDLNNGLLG